MVYFKQSAALFCCLLLSRAGNPSAAQHLRREDSKEVFYDAEFSETLSQNRFLAEVVALNNGTLSNTSVSNGDTNNSSSSAGSSNNLSVVITYEQLCELFC